MPKSKAYEPARAWDHAAFVAFVNRQAANPAMPLTDTDVPPAPVLSGGGSMTPETGQEPPVVSGDAGLVAQDVVNPAPASTQFRGWVWNPKKGQYVGPNSAFAKHHPNAIPYPTAPGDYNPALATIDPAVSNAATGPVPMPFGVILNRIVFPWKNTNSEGGTSLVGWIALGAELAAIIVGFMLGGIVGAILGWLVYAVAFYFVGRNLS